MGQPPSDVGLQPLENKVLSWGIIGKSASILAEIMIRKSQILSRSLLLIQGEEGLLVILDRLMGGNMEEAVLRYLKKVLQTYKAQLTI
jgi:hypothetical protein